MTNEELQAEAAHCARVVDAAAVRMEAADGVVSFVLPSHVAKTLLMRERATAANLEYAEVEETLDLADRVGRILRANSDDGSRGDRLAEELIDRLEARRNQQRTVKLERAARELVADFESSLCNSSDIQARVGELKRLLG